MSDPLAGLSRAQLEAVTRPDGAVLLLGGAGTGKTEALLRRFAWLAENEHAVERLVLLTRTPAAAELARRRLELLIDAPYEQLLVTTVPKLCADVLHDEAAEAGLDPFFTVLSRADRLALLLDRIDELTLRRHEIRGNPAPLLARFVSGVDRLKRELVSVADYRAYAESLESSASGEAACAQAEAELEWARLYEDHDRLLAEAGALDAGDLLLCAHRLLHDRPHVRHRVSARFEHILLDDLEELDHACGALVGLLADDHHRISAASDRDQAIDRLRGAGRKNAADFQREHPEARVVALEHSHRCPERVVEAASAVLEAGDGGERDLRGAAGGEVRFWRCSTARAQAQAVASEAERLTLAGVVSEQICVLVRSVDGEGALVGSALEERAIPHRVAGAGAYFKRGEVRDALAWLRLLADPADSGAVVRALSRPPVELRSVDLARLTQLARRRKLDMVSAVAAACEGPQLSPEGRERAHAFLKLYRGATRAFDELRPDAFMHRLIERIGLRRRQALAAQADTIDRVRAIARLSELAWHYMRREPDGSARGFARYATAVSEAAERAPEDEGPQAGPGVRVMTLESARGGEWAHVFVLGLSTAAMPGPPRRGGDDVPDALLKERLPPGGRDAHDERMRRLLHVAMTRARHGLVLSFAEGADPGAADRPSPFYEEARAALGAAEERFDERLFGPAEGLHATFRMMRDELLDTVSEIGGRLGEMRLDTYLDVSHGVARYLELLKLAALIERAKDGQPLSAAIPEVNDLLVQAATPEQRDLFATSALDDYLRDSERQGSGGGGLGRASAAEPALEHFIPRRGDGLMLSASDIETYRLCPLKYKFARVFRIPEEPTINQRFGIAVHQVLERFHQSGGGSLEYLMHLFESSWRRSGFGDSNDDLQFRERALAALRRYWQLAQDREGEPLWFERAFSFRLGAHLLRGRVDRVDRLPDGGYELIDYKTGRSKSELELREDVQLSIYQMGARESWQLETSAQSYYYVLDNEKVPVTHSEHELERVRAAVDGIAQRIMRQEFEPKPSPELCSFCDYRIICPAAEI